ncbi:MAG: hypothetical protein F4Z82_19635, partial [Caldilineaceae bacterium SB0668_bin_21]|nr:hypothetical protein [Caldilineaceae bacterium SB0668_bin_21]
MGKSERTVETRLQSGGAEEARSHTPAELFIASLARLNSPWRPTSDFSFWVSFFILNVLLFLPVVLMDREDGSLLPSFHFAGLSLEEIWIQIAIWRRGPDLLRFNSETVLFVVFWAVIQPLRHFAVRIVFVVTYLLIFFYYLYEGASLTFFSVEPVFYTQLRMATE